MTQNNFVSASLGMTSPTPPHPTPDAADSRCLIQGALERLRRLMTYKTQPAVPQVFFSPPIACMHQGMSYWLVGEWKSMCTASASLAPVVGCFCMFAWQFMLCEAQHARMNAMACWGNFVIGS